MWWIYLIKFISSVIAIFTTTLFISSIIKSIVFATFKDKECTVERQEEEEYKNANFRILIGIIMSVFWAIVIVL